MPALKGDELHAKMEALFAAYSAAIKGHQLGRAGMVRDEAAQLLTENWTSVLAALELWAFPASHGSTPDVSEYDDYRDSDTGRN